MLGVDDDHGFDQQSFRDSDHSVSPRGQGNAVSIEFNSLYHWHASICQQDEVWLNGVFEKLFEGRNPRTVYSFPVARVTNLMHFHQVTTKEFRKVIREKIVPPGGVKTWTFEKCVLADPLMISSSVI